MKNKKLLSTFHFPLPASRGQVVIIMLIIAMIVGIVIPALVFMSGNEAKWTVRETKTTRAFHLAEAGLDRGVFKLNETGIWDIVCAGAVVSDYNGQTIFSDVEGGYYKVKLSSGPDSNEVTITASGKDLATAEFRTIQAVYAKTCVKGALNAAAINVGGNAQIHWGPMYSLSTITCGALFPRKYARGYITPRYTSGALPKYGSLADEELAEWHAGYDVPDLPDIRFNDYALEAQKVTGAPALAGAVQTPAGSSYYVGSGEFKNLTNATTRTYYITGNCSFKNSYLAGNLIVRGNLDGNGNGAGSPTVNVPPDAWKEYQEYCNDTSATGQYETGSGINIDNGLHTCKPTAALTKILFKGFAHIGGNMTYSGNPGFVGCVIVIGTMSGTGTFDIYYDPVAASNILFNSSRPSRSSWKELSPNWNL
ncbi:MAG: hypothetical protein PHE88_05015 [Elusimicrobia bacterium]|nr:hypothetical protein [Elusimicrobiota bacterium]